MIDGVRVISLSTNEDERGFFREIFRFPEEFKGVNVGQLSHSLVKEGIVKAWHGHLHQHQWNYVVFGQIRVALFDNRKSSCTFREIMEFVIGDLVEPLGYYFPPGVMHGYRCIKGPMHIIYATSGTYDINDEVRKSDKELNICYSW